MTQKILFFNITGLIFKEKGGFGEDHLGGKKFKRKKSSSTFPIHFSFCSLYTLSFSYQATSTLFFSSLPRERLRRQQERDIHDTFYKLQDMLEY